MKITNGYCLIMCMGILMFSHSLISQVTDLSILGQTSGGAGSHVNWDSAGHKLIVGCGTTLQVYNMNDPAHPQLIAQRPLKGLINETEVYGNVIFAAATHDGLLAMDYNSPNLDIIAHIDMHNSGDTAAYDMWRCNDTIFLADNFRVRRYKFTGTGFTKLSSFGPYNSFCVSKKGDYIAVGGQGYPYDGILNPWKGSVCLYHTSNLNTPLAVWKDTLISFVQDIQFADLRNDILYVCAGPENILFTKSNLIALHYNGSSLLPVDTFVLSGGVLNFAQLNVMNMDSRNDTLFVVTTAAVSLTSLPWAYMPVLDATGLPGIPMMKIGEVYPGFWHFDAALMHGTPYIAMSSEWFGYVVSNVSQLNPFDTVVVYPTGGWGANNHVKDGILWACMEGYGLIGYNPDSLLYANGFHCNAQRMHIHDLNNHFFCSDVEFLNDTLLMVNSSEVYNIQPWLSGGQPAKIADMNKNWMVRMRNVQTNTGQRMVATYENLLAQTKYITLFNPYDAAGSYPDLYTETLTSDVGALAVSGDTIYFGKSYNNIRYICAVKIVNDQFVFLDTFKLRMQNPLPPLDHEAHAISIEDGKIAVAYGPQFAILEWNGNELVERNYYFASGQVALGIFLRNNFAYVGDRFFGVKVYDVSQPSQVTLAARCNGTGGWKNIYGSGPVSVDENGIIYLTDFHAGVFIIEAFDTSSVNIYPQSFQKNNPTLKMLPNPASNITTISRYDGKDFTNPGLLVFSADGKPVSLPIEVKSNCIQANVSKLKPGVYSIVLFENGKKSLSGKLVVSQDYE